MDKVSYALGLNIGRNLLDAGITDINTQDFLLAMKTILAKEDQKMTNVEAQQVLNEFFADLQAKQAQTQAKEGAEFLAQNAKRPEITTLPSGLQYQIIKSGTGPKPTANQKVNCHYHGTLIDGTVFDSSVQRGEPATFGVNQVIKGWVEALQLMPVGSKWKLYIPYDLAYGEQGAGQQIKPYSALIFEVELLSIVK